jgi:hypothetical protein
MSTTHTLSTSTAAPSTVPNRIGLVLAGLLALAQVWTAAGQLPDGLAFPLVIFAIAAIALVAIPLAWRGSARARVVVAVATILPALTGLPAFFVSDVPAAFRLAAALGIVLSVVVAVLLFTRPRAAR